jgi:hypothetical protein
MAPADLALVYKALQEVSDKFPSDFADIHRMVNEAAKRSAREVTRGQLRQICEEWREVAKQNRRFLLAYSKEGMQYIAEGFVFRASPGSTGRVVILRVNDDRLEPALFTSMTVLKETFERQYDQIFIDFLD